MFLLTKPIIPQIRLHIKCMQVVHSSSLTDSCVLIKHQEGVYCNRILTKTSELSKQSNTVKYA